jgi:hypothetical protein
MYTFMKAFCMKNIFMYSLYTHKSSRFGQDSSQTLGM